MSNDPRLAARPQANPRDDGQDTRKGSVREARERLQAAQMQKQLSERSRIGLPQRPNQLVSQFSVQKQQQDQQQQSPQQRKLMPQSSRGKKDAFAPTQQWPLPNEGKGRGQSSSSPSRGPAPQRPPRPISDELPSQPSSPDDYRASYQSDDVFSPTSTVRSSRPLTTSSVASETSSLGSIPDFPVPVPPMPTVQPLPRRQPSLGPPPSARRGPPSYYTQMSYVSPIAEESETRSDTVRSHHGSFASSNVFPYDEDYYSQQDGGMRSDDDETLTSDHKRDSRGSDHDDKSELVQPALVRQASLGRRTKPSLMTIKSVDSFGERKSSSTKRKPVADGDSASGSTASIGGAVLAARGGLAGQGAPVSRGAPLASGAVLLDPSSSSESSPSSKAGKLAYLDPEKDPDLLGYLDPEKDDMVSPVHPLQQATRQATLGERVGKRRPPRIDVDAVRDAEARGSLSSLPELIRRATRLAANLDRGKTASRLGLDFWETGEGEKNSRRSGSLSDMLAAFPPPGEATPTGDRSPNPKSKSKWLAARDKEYGGTESAVGEQKSNRRRRCCGMPMWSFVTLLIVLLFLVAAAVVIPTVLIVIPKMKDRQANSPQTTSGNANDNGNDNTPPAAAPTSGGRTSQCDGVITCQNEGVSIFNADRSCNCVCINGFTGMACETQGDAACTTTNIAGATDNATLGSSIPRLLDMAQQNFSIPLDPAGLLSLFSELGLSCTTENALVTFSGLASRSLPYEVETSLEPSKSLPLLDTPHRYQEVKKLKQRQAIGPVGEGRPNTVPPSTPGDAPAPPSASPAPAPVPTRPISSNATAIDFARIGVLLLLQETRLLNDAAKAQVTIQGFLSDNSNGERTGNTVNLGLFNMDLVNFSIEFRNRTEIIARPANSTTA